MNGLMQLNNNDFVGKKSEYKTKDDFVEAVRKEDCFENVEADDVGEGFMRYYPSGTESSALEFGSGEGVYLTVGRLTRGAFEVWIASPCQIRNGGVLSGKQHRGVMDKQQALETFEMMLDSLSYEIELNPCDLLLMDKYQAVSYAYAILQGDE